VARGHQQLDQEPRVAARSEAGGAAVPLQLGEVASGSAAAEQQRGPGAGGEEGAGVVELLQQER